MQQQHSLCLAALLCFLAAVIVTPQGIEPVTNSTLRLVHIVSIQITRHFITNCSNCYIISRTALSTW